MWTGKTDDDGRARAARCVIGVFRVKANVSTLARSALCTATVRTDCVNYVYAYTDVKDGDTVVLPEFGGTAINVGDKEMYVYREEELIGVVPK